MNFDEAAREWALVNLVKLELSDGHFYAAAWVVTRDTYRRVNHAYGVRAEEYIPFDDLRRRAV